jgi:hypothetical protein
MEFCTALSDSDAFFAIVPTLGQQVPSSSALSAKASSTSLSVLASCSAQTAAIILTLN